MQPGTKVYRGYVYGGLANPSKPYYMNSAEVTDVVVDGKQMVKVYTSLHSPDGWHETEHEAKRAVQKELLEIVRTLIAVIDDLGSVPATSGVPA